MYKLAAVYQENGGELVSGDWTAASVLFLLPSRPSMLTWLTEVADRGGGLLGLGAEFFFFLVFNVGC